VWDELMAAGKSFGIVPPASNALDMSRI